MTVLQHCLMGWNAVSPATLPTASSVSLSDALTGVNPKHATVSVCLSSLSVCLFACWPFCLFAGLSVSWSVCRPLFACWPACLFVCWPVCLLAYLMASLSGCWTVCLLAGLPIWLLVLLSAGLFVRLLVQSFLRERKSPCSMLFIIYLFVYFTSWPEFKFPMFTEDFFFFSWLCWFMSVYLSSCPGVCWPVCLPVSLFTCMSFSLHVCLCFYLPLIFFACLFVSSFTGLSSCLCFSSVCFWYFKYYLPLFFCWQW